MYGYRDYSVRTSYPDNTSYCPYFNQPQCPFFDGQRQRVEEYPIRQQQPPTSPPPSYTPKITDVAQPNLTSVAFGAISPCIFRMTYLWLKSGISFWAYLTFINRTTASGWRYQNNQWLQFSVDLSEIQNYICS